MPNRWVYVAAVVCLVTCGAARAGCGSVAERETSAACDVLTPESQPVGSAHASTGVEG